MLGKADLEMTVSLSYISDIAITAFEFVQIGPQKLVPVEFKNKSAIIIQEKSLHITIF